MLLLKRKIGEYCHRKWAIGLRLKSGPTFLLTLYPKPECEETSSLAPAAGYSLATTVPFCHDGLYSWTASKNEPFLL